MSGTAVRADPSDTPAPVPYRNPDTALTLSLAGTAASAAVFAYGLASHNTTADVIGLTSSLVTPMLGEWYAGRPLTVGLGIRVAAGVLMLAAEEKAAACDGDETSGCNAVGPMLITGMLAYGGGVAWDIVTARNSTFAFNAAHAPKVRFAPTVLTSPSGPVMGLGLGGAF
jgi:hypothetical protein